MVFAYIDYQQQPIKIADRQVISIKHCELSSKINELVCKYNFRLSHSHEVANAAICLPRVAGQNTALLVHLAPWLLSSSAWRLKMKRKQNHNNLTKAVLITSRIKEIVLDFLHYIKIASFALFHKYTYLGFSNYILLPSCDKKATVVLWDE